MAGNPGEIRSAVLGRRASNTENWSTVEVSRNGGNWARSTLRNDTKRSEIAEGQTSDYQNLETPRLHGRDKELAEMISDIKAFIKKLVFWEQSFIDGDTRHFPVLLEKISQSPSEPCDSKYHVEIVSDLKDNFKNRFKDFNEIAIAAQLVVSTLHGKCNFCYAEFQRRHRCDRNGMMNERPIRSNTFRLMTKIANMTKRKKLGKFKLLEEVWQTEKKIWKHKLQEIFIVKSICKKMFLGAISEILANRVNILNKHIIEIYEDVNFPKIPRNLPEILFKQKLNRRFYVKDYSANNFQGNTEKL
ncbi:unnamed protein product [Acanthoscelides obtectus]|uniref:Uncharacterized protein n=1 Tax=Acanthoscelides obtectus TaxID=200917 RepID=A0A9P0K8J9_ACAOB|nr:unnamed protein product [Acanthoscelides obtectus]CAK1673429.1 hypothetical protein AOBTE_LOCUS29336 [Acanthoscelides obtectus]